MQKAVFVFPSLREGWPNAVQEALAAGLPVVARAVGGIPDMVEGCPSGFLLAADAGPGDWVRAIHRVLESDQAQLRAASLERARKLSWESMLNLWAPAYQEFSHG
jgi:D-inositol-3-phosphate glycosyltransferase